MSEIIYNLRLFFDFSPTELGVTAFFLILILGFRGTKLRTWTVLTGIFLLLMEVDLAVWYVFGGLVAFNIAPLRRILVSNLVFYVIGKLNFVPKISETERIALEAGTVWVEGEFFSGKPDFKRVFSEDYPSLSVEEQAFLDGPAETLCSMVDDWEVHQNRGFSDEVWAYMKDNGFFGMIIPKKYGGLEFSAVAHGAIIAKLSARCSPLGITVMVPNSLGPGELINHYGTDAQRDYYLPRLAKGQDIPCFGLTEPDAGSDAGAMTSRGDLFKGDDGKLYIRLNWKKRYITLSGLSSIIGLAFKLYDPEKLLGKSDSFGITCALVPSDAAGVVLGRYHDPLGIPFCNCPTEGHDVVISADAIIGGVERAGSGWKMLMESLATGRGISLPATCAGGSKLVTKVVSAYTAVRKQFGVSIGQFEGIESPLSRISGMTYIIESASRFTCGAIDRGVKPSVVSAIIKYHTTEMLRTVINDGMDVLGGKAISRGPKNLLAHPYFGIPVGITVEGANILTRTLIIFGQGAIRCHPFALKQVNAIESGDKKAFDLAFWGHAGHVFRNKTRMLVLWASRGRLAQGYGKGPVRKYTRRLAWVSATFAFYADLALMTLGGSLKRKESLTGRFGDVLSWMFLAAAVLRRYEADGHRKEDLAFLEWSMAHAFSEIQTAFEGLLANGGWLFKVGYYMVRFNSFGTPPSDKQSHRVASLIQVPGEQRDRLTEGLFQSKDASDPLAEGERAFRLAVQTQDTSRKIRRAVKRREISKGSLTAMLSSAAEKGLITEEEALLVSEAEEARDRVIEVDDFDLTAYKSIRA